MARCHDQSGIRNFDLAPAAILRTEPAVSDGLPISGPFQIARPNTWTSPRYCKSMG
jgi:hypothetical protein